jgi:hypothetical protein
MPCDAAIRQAARDAQSERLCDHVPAETLARRSNRGPTVTLQAAAGSVTRPDPGALERDPHTAPSTSPQPPPRQRAAAASGSSYQRSSRTAACTAWRQKSMSTCRAAEAGPGHAQRPRLAPPPAGGSPPHAARDTQHFTHPLGAPAAHRLSPACSTNICTSAACAAAASRARNKAICPFLAIGARGAASPCSRVDAGQAVRCFSSEGGSEGAPQGIELCAAAAAQAIKYSGALTNCPIAAPRAVPNTAPQRPATCRQSKGDDVQRVGRCRLLPCYAAEQAWLCTHALSGVCMPAVCHATATPAHACRRNADSAREGSAASQCRQGGACHHRLKK